MTPHSESRSSKARVTEPAAPAVSFEERLGRLEAIVHELEGDSVELARALELFEEGVESLRLASQELSRVRNRVQRLVERADGSFELTDMRE